MGRAALTLAIALCLLVAGCAAPSTAPSATTVDRTTTADGGSPDDTTTADGGSPDDTTTTFPSNGPADPPEDRLGWEDGRWYNETIAVDPGDGYNDSELAAVVDRTMARVEYVRQLEFTQDVDVRVITREEYREQNVFEFDPDPFRDQVWEAMFVVNESTHAATALNAVYGGSVAGYYSGGEIVLVSDDSDAVQVSRETLAHELVHALQDQHGLFSRRGETSDARSAAIAVSEGDANFVMDLYVERCGSEWQCIPAVERGNSSRSINQGLFLSVFLPYSDGPTLVEAVYDRGGWDAVNRLYDDKPTSTEQVIHPERYPDEGPAGVTVDDRSNDEWEPIGSRGGEQDTLGEATLYAMFWYNGVVPEDHLTSDAARYNYSHPITDGWAGDAVLPYRNGDQYGYVFETAWDSRRDADQFYRAYLDLLEKRGAEEVREGVYRIPDDDPYGDAFRVTRRGTRVVVVNAPTVEELDEVRPA